jgi:hypothetical protein
MPRLEAREVQCWKFGVRDSGFGICEGGFGPVRSDKSQLRSAEGLLREIVAWQELFSEFITGLRRHIGHARENVVYLLPVYPFRA